MPFALYPLILAAFGIGTTEFVIMGLLPDVALDLGMTIPKTGLVVTAYAIGVVVGGPVLALITAGRSERRTLLELFGLFAVGNLLCGLAPSFAMLIVARIITAFSHGTFLGIASVVAMSLAPSHRRTEAVGYLLSGIVSANVVGVPAGVALGHAFGWRWAFLAVAFLAVVSWVLLWATLPNRPAKPSLGVRHEMRALASRGFWAAVALSVACSTTLLCLFTFIAPFLLDVTLMSHSEVTTLLMVYGTGLTVGTTLGGKIAEQQLLRPIAWGLGLGLAVLVALPFVAHSKWPCAVLLCLWGSVSFGLCPILQTLVVSRAPDAAALASTLNHSAFNMGNALGAWVGSVALSHGLLMMHLPWASAGLSVVAIGILAVQRRVAGVIETASSQHLVGH